MFIRVCVCEWTVLSEWPPDHEGGSVLLGKPSARGTAVSYCQATLLYVDSDTIHYFREMKLFMYLFICLIFMCCCFVRLSPDSCGAAGICLIFPSCFLYAPWITYRKRLHKRCKFSHYLLTLTPTGSRVKFHSPQNNSGALRQNRVSEF